MTEMTEGEIFTIQDEENEADRHRAMRESTNRCPECHGPDGLHNRACTQQSLYYDYDKQCWVREGKVAKCGHQLQHMEGCYACSHHGEEIDGSAADD